MTTRSPLKALLLTLGVLGAIGAAMVLGYVLLLFLMSDRAPDPEVQPLEVVVNSRRQPDTPCLLNVDEVRAGDHAVSVIGESGFAEVRIVDERGKVVFRTDNEGQRIVTDEDGDITIIGGEAEGEGPEARLSSGTFTVECDPAEGEPGKATSRSCLPDLVGEPEACCRPSTTRMSRTSSWTS